MGGKRQFKAPNKQAREIEPGDKVFATLEVPGVKTEPRKCAVIYVHPRGHWCTVETERGIRFSPWIEDVARVG